MASSRHRALNGMRILAVEDQEDLREMLIAVLEQQGAEVIGCASALKAFEVLTSGTSIDAALFDITMPGEDGLALVCRWRLWESCRSPGHLPVIALTALVASDMQQRCAAAGFDHYLSKPFCPDVLFATLQRLAPMH